MNVGAVKIYKIYHFIIKLLKGGKLIQTNIEKIKIIEYIFSVLLKPDHAAILLSEPVVQNCVYIFLAVIGISKSKIAGCIIIKIKIDNIPKP